MDRSTIITRHRQRYPLYIPWLIALEIIIGFVIIGVVALAGSTIPVSARKWLLVMVSVLWSFVPITIGMFWNKIPNRSKRAWKLFAVLFMGSAAVRASRLIVEGNLVDAMRQPILGILVIIVCFYTARFLSFGARILRRS